MALDSATWLALGLVLTLLGLGLSTVVWVRKGPARGLRAVAWSLLPLAAALTGVLRLVGQVGEAVTTWAVRLVLSPVVWLGIVLAGVSLVLFVVSGWLGRRQARRAPAAQQRTTAPTREVGRGSTGDQELDDIDALLRRHGIS